MAGELVSFGIQKLWDLLSQEFERFQGVEEQVTGLKFDLNWLSSFLKDAYAKKHRSAVVKNCVEEIKEIVYDVEDIIETYLLNEKLGKTSGIKMSIRRHVCFISDRRRYALDIGGIRTRISYVIQNMQSFGVQQIITDGGYMQPLRDRQREMRQTFPNDYESDFVGFEATVKKLVGYFIEEDNIQIISVTGMGGLGKTTLARQVFNHEDVKRQYDGLAWVCISQDFTRKNVWQKILGDLKPKEDEKKILEMTESTLQNELFRLLETSKSLIVFDDIWKEEDWDLIKPIFPPTKGWKVLLTSRNKSVAMRGDMTYINFKPDCLTIQDSWTLFQRIAMPRKDAPEFNKEMEEMGKQMIKHCGGLPLAIKVLGGLLAAKYTVRDWKRLSENIGSHLVGGRTDSNDDNNNSVDYVLSLSFEELPSYLKHCFIYLAHFPEDYKINVEKLSYYWAAEGIFEHRQYDGETIRDVGDSYIEELVRRNMVISVREATTLRFETCHLHDMMREVCLFKAKEENFLQITSSSPPTANFQSHVKSRRLVSHNPTTLHVERDINNPKLRSLVVFQVNEPWGEIWKLSGSSYTRLELLRVLDLCNAKFRGRKLASCIGKLIHLRYLSLKGAEVSHLPSSLGNLLLLIYLNLDTLGSIFVPNVLMGMQELRYLALPIPMHKKTKLKLGNLEKLETLENFSTENSSVKDLQRMTKLRTLSIKIRGEGCATETLSSSLSELRHLEDLTIYEGSTNDGEGFVLDCVNLKQLDLRIYMPKLPDEHHFPSHLTSISLEACRLVEDPMPILEKLVQLKELKLQNQSFSGRKIVCSAGGFPQLQELIIEGLDEWEEWIVEEGSMPLLHSLDIQRCPKLKKLEFGFPQLQKLRLRGLEEWEEWIVEEGSMPLLHSLEIWDCPKLKELPAGGFPQLHSLYLNGLEEWEEWIVEEGSMPLLHSFYIYDCPKLKKLPTVEFPQLQNLELNRLEWEEWIVEEGSMPLLHSLSILQCPKLKKLAGGFPQLQKLELNIVEWEEWIVEEGSMPLLHSLSILQCPKLKKLAGGFPQLQKLYLFGLEEWEEWIVEEGSMPLLHSLYIYDCPKLKKLPTVGFPQLQKLELNRLEWEEWIVEESSMPLLHTLEISDCKKLKKLSDGLSLIYSLKDLTMDKEWKERLSEAGEDYYKVKHIPSVKFDEE